LGHPAYSQDLALCNFLLFVYMKEQLKGRSFTEEEGLSLVISELMSEIPPDMILRRTQLHVCFGPCEAIVH
jgi:hypothetical protein